MKIHRPPLVIDLLLRAYRSLPGFRGKYRLGYWLFRRWLEKPHPVEVLGKSGVRYQLPNSIENIGKEIIIKGEYEQDSVSAICAALKAMRGRVFFDIGANIGSIAIPVKKRMPSVEVHAFEASPATCRFLEKNLALNGLSSVQVHNRLVFSADNQSLHFFDSAAYYGKSSLAPTYSDRSVTVRSVTIDEYCRQRQINQIDLVKVDVQGFETNVFQGMRSCLQQKRVATIFFEFEDWAEEAAGFRPGESQEFLLNRGYEIFNEKGVKLAQPVRTGSQMLWAKPAKMSAVMPGETRAERAMK